MGALVVIGKSALVGFGLAFGVLGAVGANKALDQGAKWLWARLRAAFRGGH